MNFSHGKNVDLDLLAALDLLLTERNVTRAAERAGLTQSAMSHKLKALRDALGDPLLVGGRGGLVPTARAQAMAGPLRRALTSVRAAIRVGEPFDAASATRTFVIATSDYGEFLAFPTLFELLRHEAPGVRLVATAPGRDLNLRLESGAIDLAVGAFGTLEGASIVRRKLTSEGFLVAGRAAHPALQGKLTLRRYLALHHLLIAPRGMLGGVVDDKLAAAGRERIIALRLPHFVTAPFVVARTDLVVTAPMGLIREAQRYVALATVEPPIALPRTDLHMVWHERSQQDDAHRWLRDLIERTLRTVLQDGSSI